MGFMGLFGKSGATAELPAALDLSQGDKDAARIRTELARGNWKPAHEFLKSVTDMNDLDFYIDMLSRWPGRPGWIQRWQKGDPESEFTAMISGAHNIEWAWEARGAGTADTVTDDAGLTFVSRMSEAEIDMVKASHIAPSNPVPWAHLISTAFTVGRDDAEVEARFKAAIARNPHYRLAHSRYLYSLCAKWGGSHEKMFQFARDTRKKAPEGSLLHAIIAEAHIERWLGYYMENDAERGAQYFSLSHVREEIEDAWEHSLRSKSLMKTKRIYEDRNRFAFCFFYLGEKEKAREEFRAIGSNVTEFPWALVGRPIEKFAGARNEVL